ncbi:MAG: PTS sugar transporter subunit IIA [Acholeplasmataceae bacterium]|nr:PTS sugar transporter subunit IIA [Acholeplasmataceae bacterium]
MLTIHELTNLSLIHIDLKSLTKDGVLFELAHYLHKENRIADTKLFLDDIYEREAIVSTGIGMKIAIPHAKSKHVLIPSVIFGKSEKGIEFNSLDSKPAHLFFMIAMPEDSANQHLKVLALLSRKLMHESFREALMQAKTKEEVLALLYTME